jgi:hypothetical protein
MMENSECGIAEVIEGETNNRSRRGYRTGTVRNTVSPLHPPPARPGAKNSKKKIDLLVFLR